MDVRLEILPADDTTMREALEIAQIMRRALERSNAVSAVVPVQILAPEGAKSGIVELLHEFGVALVPGGLKSMLALLKEIATRPRQPRTKIVIKGKGKFEFEFDPTTISIEDLVTNVSRLPGLQ